MTGRHNTGNGFWTVSSRFKDAEAPFVSGGIEYFEVTYTCMCEGEATHTQPFSPAILS